MLKQIAAEIESQLHKGLKENNVRECYVYSVEIYW